MNSREKVLRALSHREPDRIPVDFGSSSVTGMHVSCIAALRDWLGLEKRLVKAYEPGQMLGWIEDDLAEALGLDCVAVIRPKTRYGYFNRDWKSWRMPDGLEVLVGGGFTVTRDPDGSWLMHPQSDATAPPAARMPDGGYFFDAVVHQQPIVEEELNPADNLEEFGPIPDQDIEHLRAEAVRARATGRAVMAAFGGTGLGDIANVPGPMLKFPKGIRDPVEWYMSTTTRRDYIHRVFDRQTQTAVENFARIHGAVGGLVDTVYLCGTDFGTQTSSFCSVPVFRELWLPYYQRMTRWIHAHTNWKVFKHSCGSVERFIPSFIEAGFDILNPVQCSARNMEPERLKSAYGGRIVFWGGGVDTQHTLAFGTPADVRRQVLERAKIFSAGGGFVFNAIHNVQARTPLANIVAMFDAVKEFEEAGACRV